MTSDEVQQLLNTYNRANIKKAIEAIRSDGRKKTYNRLLDFCGIASINPVDVYSTNFLDFNNKKLGDAIFKEYADVLPLFENVNTVRLYNNELKKIPKFLYELPNLIDLDLCENKIKKIYISDIRGLCNIEILHLNKNNLTELPDEFAELYALRILSLNDNNITSFPDILMEMKSLDSLSITKKSIKYLKKEVKEFLSYTGWEEYHTRCVERQAQRIKKKKK